MKNSEIKQKDQHIRQVGIDPQAVLTLILKNWYYFVIGIVVALIAAKLYISHTLPVFQSSTTILINETEERTLAANEEFLQGLGLPGGMRNLDNQIMILTSRALTEKALKLLPFEIEFYHKTIRNELPIYPEVPIEILSDNKIPLPRDTEFSILYTGDNNFILQSESEFYPYTKTAEFGESINLPDGNFRLECRDENWMDANRDKKLYFLIYSPVTLTSYFNRRIVVGQESRTGSILRVSMQGTNRNKDVDFLNMLAEVFQESSLEKKNIEAVRRIQFIDEQLIGISDSLSITESKLQQFRSSNKVMDLSAQGQAIIQQVTILENERARLNLESNYYDYLADYLAKDVVGELPIIPITMGITDPGLTRLVTELADLQGQLSARGASDMNPVQNLIFQKVKNTKDALLETLNGLRRANSLAKNENQKQINRINTQASELPITERQLLGIERKFRLNDEMYTFLLETRAEQQMQKASNMPDCEIIDRADEHFAEIIAPTPVKVYFVGFFAGVGIPFSILLLIFLFNNKLKLDDLIKIENIPVVGYIPHSSEKINTVVFDNPNSIIAENYRLLRSKMQFFTKDVLSPVILITSSMPSEGKTYTAINLASVYSMLGKKTILLDFDLRKPKIYKDFNLKKDRGISTWLIGASKLEDIIQETSYENLSVITSGPVPPNPSELIAMEKTSTLLKILRERYDIIIIDSAPIGVVSDSFHLAPLADTKVIVVRPEFTLKVMLETTLNQMNSNISLGILVNDIKSGNNFYKYQKRYGYKKEE